MMDLGQGNDLTVYERSVTEMDGATFFLGRTPQGKVLGIQGEAAGFEGERRGELFLGPLSAANAARLRERLAWLRPRPLGSVQSAGCGDRLGLATPGHIRALRRVSGIAPVLAQQSVRENARTGRTPRQVLDDAMWGVFQEGWRAPWGADADHLKLPTSVDDFVSAGYTQFTIDPGDHVDGSADAAPRAEVMAKAERLPWETLEDTARDLERRYLDRPFDLGDRALALGRETLWRAAVKYGRAIVHTAQVARHLAERMAGRDFDLEVSVDETETPTSHEEHLFIARELRRMGVRWVSLAPRYVGRFEKGVDYIGDLSRFEEELVGHAAIARALGPYKLSIHSGSDKFSIYPIVARLTEGLVHLKTAGTSYLEALRTVAGIDAALFRSILEFARRRYAQDRSTYIVSADVAALPPTEALADAELPGVLDTFAGRQVLHVTFGSVLAEFGGQLKAVLDAHEEAHYAALEAHILRHLLWFAWAGRSAG